MTDTAAIPYRPLGLIKEMMEAVGQEITYVYEDLVFIEHNAYLLQMGARGCDIDVWFNTESDSEARPGLLEVLQQAGNRHQLELQAKGTYSLTPGTEGEEMVLQFFE